MQLSVSIIYAVGCLLLIALLFLTQGEESGTSSFTTSMFHNWGTSVKTTTMVQRLIALLFIGLIAVNLISKRIILKNKTLLSEEQLITAKDLAADSKAEQPSIIPPVASPVVPQKPVGPQRSKTISKTKDASKKRDARVVKR